MMSDDQTQSADDDGSMAASDRRDALWSGSTDREVAELYVELGAQIAAATTSDGALAAVTAVALTAVPGAHHASITRGRGERSQTLAPTDEIMSQADRSSTS